MRKRRVCFRSDVHVELSLKYVYYESKFQLVAYCECIQIVAPNFSTYYMWFILYNIQTTLYKPLLYCNVLHLYCLATMCMKYCQRWRCITHNNTNQCLVLDGEESITWGVYIKLIYIKHCFYYIMKCHKVTSQK